MYETFSNGYVYVDSIQTEYLNPSLRVCLILMLYLYSRSYFGHNGTKLRVNAVSVIHFILFAHLGSFNC